MANARAHAPWRARWLTVGVAVATAAAVAVPVLGSGQPDLATRDADRTAADATASVDDEVALLDALTVARSESGLRPLSEHPEAARLARDWAQVMAGAESRDDLAACADLADPAPGPVWHPRDPHLDLGSPYLGDIGEVVGCFADEVDAQTWLANRLADPEHAGELLEPAFRNVGIGVVDGPASEAGFVTVVLMDGTARTPDRRGVAELLAGAADRGRDSVDAVLLAPSGPMTALLRAAPVARGAVPALATDRAVAVEPDPLLANRVRARIDGLTGGAARILAVGATDALSERSLTELASAGYEVRRLAARGYGTDASAPVQVPADVSSGPHAPAIGALTEARVLIGRGDVFDPQGTITRGQIATMLARALDLPQAGSDRFRDTAGSVHAPAIAAAAASGIIQGFEDGTFRPQQPVTRGQLASMIARAFELRASSGASAPADAVGSPHTAAIAAVVEAGIVGGFPDGTFRAGDTATRAQTATFVLNALLLS